MHAEPVRKAANVVLQSKLNAYDVDLDTDIRKPTPTKASTIPGVRTHSWNDTTFADELSSAVGSSSTWP